MVGFALSKTPHLHRAYLVTVRKRKSMTVDTHILLGGGCIMKTGAWLQGAEIWPNDNMF